jgi:ATP-binding cassette subfamily A (ABC1) protein 2
VHCVAEVRVWDEMEYVSGSLLYANQFWAILVKRFYYVWRNRKGLFSQIILPAVFVCVAMTVALSAPQVHDLPALVLSPAQYYNGTRVQGGSFVPYSVANATEFARTRDADAQQLVQTFSRPCGLSATCVLRDARWNSSVDDFIKNIVERSHRDYSQIRQYFNEECESVFYNGKDATVREKPMYWHQEAKDSYVVENDTELGTC